MWERAFKSFLKEQIAEEKSISTGSVLMDRIFNIPLESFLLIKGPSRSGTTPVLLEVLACLSHTNTIVFFDYFNSFVEYRTKGFNLDNVLILRSPHLTQAEIKKLLFELKDLSPIIAFDDSHFIANQLNGLTFDAFVTDIKNLIPKSTIIATQKTKKVSNLWTTVVTVDPLENIYKDEDGENLLVGQLSSVTGPKGKETLFFSFYTGRYSKAYEYVKLEMENGKATNSSYTFDGITVQGYWNLIHEVGKKERNELEISRV